MAAPLLRLGPSANLLLVVVATLAALLLGPGPVSSSSSPSAASKLQESVKQSLVRDPFRALDQQLTKLTHSRALKDNQSAARRMLEHKTLAKTVEKKHKTTVKHLARALAELSDQSQVAELCGAHNLANVRLLVEAMARSSRHPTSEPESRRRLNLLLMKLTNEVRSYCYAHLEQKWRDVSSEPEAVVLGDRHLAPLDQVPFSYLFRDQLKNHPHNQPSGVSKHRDLDPLIEHLKGLLSAGENNNNRDQQRQLVLGSSLVSPCQQLTTGRLAREVLQPRVDLTAIALVVYQETDLARRDYESHPIGPLKRFIMCQKLLEPASSSHKYLLSGLFAATSEANESRATKKMQRKLGEQMFERGAESGSLTL